MKEAYKQVQMNQEREKGFTPPKPPPPDVQRGYTPPKPAPDRSSSPPPASNPSTTPSPKPK